MDTINVLKRINKQKKEKVLMETIHFQERLFRRAMKKDFPICEKLKMIKIIHSNIKEHFSMKLSKVGTGINEIAQRKVSELYDQMGEYIRKLLDEYQFENRQEIENMMRPTRVEVIRAHEKEYSQIVIITNALFTDINDEFFKSYQIDLGNYNRYMIINVPNEITSIDLLIDVTNTPENKFSKFEGATIDIQLSDVRDHDIVFRSPECSYDAVLNFMVSCITNTYTDVIMMTLYRTDSPDSHIVNLLCEASAKYNKSVFVYIEPNAKGNERMNLEIMNKLKMFNVIVLNSCKFKVHAKMFLALSTKTDEMYAHFSTGNYNLNSVGVYTDIQLFTSDPSKIIPAADIFKNQMIGLPIDVYGIQYPNRLLRDKASIWFSPRDLKNTFIGLIYNEIGKGKDGRIIIKANSLADPEIISHLYAAVEAGVNVRVIIRSICLMEMVPWQLCDDYNLEIESYCGRYLEHDRIYIFGDRVFIASADLSFRNMHKRIEYMAELTNDKNKRYIEMILDTLFLINGVKFVKVADPLIGNIWECVSNLDGELVTDLQEKLIRESQKRNVFVEC